MESPWAHPREAAEYLLHPMAPETFLAEWYEKRPVVIRRPHPTHLEGWMTLESFLGLLTGTHAPMLNLRVACGGKMIPDVGLRAAMDAWREGATVIVNQIHLLHPPTARFCRLLEGFFYQNFQANGYLQPAGMKGFGGHYDGHDEFDLQIFGKKAWKIYGPLDVELPLPEQHRNAYQLDPNAVPLFEAVTEPGDLIYIPRGFVHAAHATDEAPSLHVTVGMIPATWRDLLVMAVQDATARHPALRRQVPTGPHVAPLLDAAAGLDEALRLVVDEVRARALENVERRFALSRTAVQPAFTLQGAPLEMDTAVMGDPLVICSLSRNVDQATVSFQGKELPFPRETAGLLESILIRQDQFCARDLDGGLDAHNRLRLVQHLLDHGVLVRAPAAEEAVRRRLWESRNTVACGE